MQFCKHTKKKEWKSISPYTDHSGLSLAIIWKFSAIDFLSTFSALSSFFSFQDSNDMKCYRSFVIAPEILEALFNLAREKTFGQQLFHISQAPVKIILFLTSIPTSKGQVGRLDFQIHQAVMRNPNYFPPYYPHTHGLQRRLFREPGLSCLAVTKPHRVRED